MTCGDCHLSGGSDVDDYSFDNGTLAAISSAEWSWSGHGKTTGNYDASSNPAADFPGAAGLGDPCLYCHDPAASHNDGSNPFRLRNFDALGNGWNDVCLICHKTGQTTYDPDDTGPLTNKVATVYMNKYHDSPTYTASPRDGGTLCFDCHDPHGDRIDGSGNIYMIQSSVTVNKADAYGTPGTTASVDFQDKSAGNGNDYAKEDPGSPGTYIGICQVCHGLTKNHTVNGVREAPESGSSNQLHKLTTSPGCVQNGCHLHETNAVVDGLAFKQLVSGDSCADCHSSAGGPDAGTTPDAGHANHIQNAFVGLLSSGDYGNYTTNTWYTFDNTGGTPDIGCGHCHPYNLALHDNGTINVTFDPNDRGAEGTTKDLNKPGGPWYSGTGDSVTCSGVYCHSTGYINPATGEYAYSDSPAWGTGTFADVAEDRCAGCHGNPPNSTDSTPGRGLILGSLSHYNTDYMGQGVTSGHFVGIHYDNVYTGTTGLEESPAGTQNSHGVAGTSTTINCNTCHNSTITSTANDMNEICATCHDNIKAAVRGNMDIDSLSTTHINGTAEVVFENITFNSKSQVRDDAGVLTELPEIDTYWTRNNSYKAGATSYDGSKASLNTSSYSSGTCSSVACHNGYDVAWDDQKVDCLSCHKALLR
jgi:predicted CxxxxCH...CXXCH cytochrome family protein